MQRILLSVLLVHLCLIVPAQTTYYVDAARPDNSGAGTSWATAKRDLQVAINGAAANDQVWIKAGTYTPTHDPFGSTSPADNRDKAFTLKSGVKVYGGFAGTETLLSQRNWSANNSILSGDLGTVNVLTDNAYHVVLSVNLTAATVLDGVTITKGYATAPVSSTITVGTRVLTRYYGGGVYGAYSAATFANCTITGNSADNTDNTNDAKGAGVYTDNCTSAFTNCWFDGNSFLVTGNSFGAVGSGMYITGGNCTITGCAFVNNTSGGNFFGGSSGGGLYMGGTSTSVTNSVFCNNSAMNGAALAVGGTNNFPVVTNCTFVGNTSYYAGTGYSGFSKGVFHNCIFWNNTPTVNPVAGRNEIVSQETNAANQPTFTNCIVRESAAVMNTIMTGCITTDPLLVNSADGDGPDNKFMTADDGLRLQCGSPAINAGTGSTPATDILSLARIGVIDIGAYESGHNSTAFNTIPSANTTVQLSQSTGGVTHYSDCTNKVLQIQSGGAYTLSGPVTAKVWIEASQSAGFAKRHYEITPQTNPGTATARVTLYFRQQEFTDFNAVNTIKLPTGPGDATGIANLKIEKRAGTSSNGTGLPDTYSGTRQTISGAALSVSWNATASRWEVSFDVTGFSGFFVKTQSFALPLRLDYFSGRNAGECNELQWETADEVSTKEFEIQKSTDGRSFSTIAVKVAIGSGSNLYQYKDCPAATGKTYYQLKMIDIDGRFTYSPVVTIDTKAGLFVKLQPNPAKDFLVISSNQANLVHTRVKVIDATGRVAAQATINGLPYRLSIDQLPAGVYYLQLQNGKTVNFVKQR